MESSPTRLLSPGRNWTKGQVRLLSWGERRLAVKDMRGAHPIFRGLLGGWVIRHEFSILEELEGVRGIPQAFDHIDRWAFARDFVDGKPLCGFRSGEVADRTFLDLEQVVRRVHSRGIAHGDLHHRDIILNPHGEPHLIDFSTAVRRGHPWNPVKRWLFRQYCRMDQRAILKLKSRFLPGNLSPREKRLMARGPILHRLGKWLRYILISRKR